MRMATRWTREDEELLLGLIKEGRGIEEIALKMGRSKRVITYRKWGLRPMTGLQRGVGV